MAKLCLKAEHAWRDVRGGKYQRCEKCLTHFPCKHDCEHHDCILVRSGRASELGEDLPGWPLTAEDPLKREDD